MLLNSVRLAAQTEGGHGQTETQGEKPGHGSDFLLSDLTSGYFWTACAITGLGLDSSRCSRQIPICQF